MKLIDSHAHLDFSEFHPDLAAVLERARVAGVEKIINIGADLDRSQTGITIAENYENIWATVGVHPDEASHIDLETVHNELMELAKSSDKVVGIGECGLDYYRTTDKAEMSAQKRLFEIHIDVAKHLNLPLVIHIRNGEDELATEEAYEILKKVGYNKGVIHCFSLNSEWAKLFTELGFYLGFTGIITYKNAETIRESVQNTDLGRIIVETDCPFLASQNHRGERNEPAFVAEVANKIAEIKGLSLEKVADSVTMNTEKLFQIQNK